MDLERLNKSQIVLLTLLVSFVTSIATGIVAVTLMEQAPPAITQTVNRVVERTVEKVIPQEGQVAAASNVVTEKIVTVRESDLVAKAIADVSPSVVRLYTLGRDEQGKDARFFIGMALVANENGGLLADAGTSNGPLIAVRSDGIEVPVQIIAHEAGVKVIQLQAPTTTEQKKDDTTETVALSWTPATFSTAKSVLGETVITIGGKTSTRVANGIITAISDEKDEVTVAVIETSIPVDSFAAGSPLINTDGEVIGMATRETRDASTGFLASAGVVSYNKADAEGQTASAPQKTP